MSDRIARFATASSSTRARATPRRHARRLGVWSSLLVGLWLVSMLLIRLASAPMFIEAAIERAESYANVCLAVDPECSVDSLGRVDLGDEPSSLLNLMAHLLGSTVSASLDPLQAWRLLQVVSPQNLRQSLPLFATHIFHPPRA